jgi:transcription elongation factor
METTDKNGRDIKVGDYVKVINRITGSVEDSGMITKIDGKQVHLGVGTNIIGMEISNVYLRDQVIKY